MSLPVPCKIVRNVEIEQMRVHIGIHNRDYNSTRQIPDQLVAVIPVKIGLWLVSCSIEVLIELMLTDNTINQAVFDTTVYHRLNWLSYVSLPPTGEDQ